MAIKKTVSSIPGAKSKHLMLICLLNSNLSRLQGRMALFIGGNLFYELSYPTLMSSLAHH